MSKQIGKQTNNKRLALKKGQIAILEALYGGRFGRCWLFWVGLGYPPEYTYLTKPPFRVTMKTMSSLERKYSNNNHNDTYKAPLWYRLRTKIAVGMVAAGAVLGFNSLSHEDNTDNAPKELACVSEQTTLKESSDAINKLSNGINEEDGKERTTAVQYDAQAQQARLNEAHGGSVDKDAPVNVTVCRTDNGNLEARVDTIGSHPEESDR